MFKTVFRTTLAAVVLTFFAYYPLLYASDSGSTDHGPHDKLNHALRLELNTKRKASEEFNTLQTVNRIVGDMALGYSAKLDAIEKGKSVTIAAAIGAIGSAVVTGGVTIPTVSGLIGAAKVLSLSWDRSDNFLHRYDEALKMKIAQVAKTKEAIKAYDNAYNKYVRERSNHLNSVTTHNAIHHSPILKQWNCNPDYSLPDFRCGGDCRQTFNSPLGEHGEVCGAKKKDDSSVPAGCFDVWYSCVEKDVKEHQPVKCTLSVKLYTKLPNANKVYKNSVTCGEKFRRCIDFVDRGYHERVYDTYLDGQGNERLVERWGGYVIDYNKWTRHKHDPNHSSVNPDGTSDEGDDEDGDDSADAGDDSSSAMHACGIHATTVSGSHSRITPPCGDSAHAGYACQISSDHNTAMSGWSGTFYECQPHTDYACGHTDPTANAAYHAPKTCTQTNAQGDSCEATGLYECQSHTCVYSCGRSGCTQTVSSSTQHSATCGSGHSYWTCNPSDVSLHITRTCRYSECGKSWERCSTVGGTPLCDYPWRKERGLPCWKK